MKPAWLLLAAVVLAGCTGSQGGDTVSELTLRSPAFNDGGEIPEKHGYTADNVNPRLEIFGVPEGTQSLVLIMDDPDAVEPAGKVWDHWVLYDIPPETRQIRGAEAPGTEGVTDYGEVGYGGPNPPDKQHTYVFTLYAVDTELGLDEGASKEEVEDAIEGHVIGKAVLTGTYAP